MELILGSQSPRRREIMSYFTLPFKQVTSHFDENSILFQGDPIRYAQEISFGKSQALQQEYKEQIILTADTVVYREGKIYGKPSDEQEAFLFLSELLQNLGLCVLEQGMCSGDKEIQIMSLRGAGISAHEQTIEHLIIHKYR